MKTRLLNLVGIGLLVTAATPAFAVVAFPEIDASMAPQLMTLLGGAFLVYRGRRR